MISAVLIVALVFAVLHYQNNSFSHHLDNEGKQSSGDFNYYSGNKAFNESYQREKALKQDARNQDPKQKTADAEVDLNVSTTEQSTSMEETLRKEKTALHEEQVSEIGHNDASTSPADQPPARYSGAITTNQISQRWSGSAGTAFGTTNAAVIEASSEATGAASNASPNTGQGKKPASGWGQ